MSPTVMTGNVLVGTLSRSGSTPRFLPHLATLVRWEPFREIAGLQNELSRFMNGLFEGPGRTNQAWVPALDVWETESEVLYALDLPGVPEEKISVELDDGALTINAERERTEEESDERIQVGSGRRGHDRG